jgi:type I restriction enzyme S subunit
MTLKDAGVQLIDCDHRTPVSQQNGYPYIAIPQLKDGHVKVDDSVRRISEADFLDWTKKLSPQEHDVIVVRRCNSGDSAVVPKGVKWAIGQNLVILRSDGRKVFPPYLRWLLRSNEWWSEVKKYINVGAVFDSLKCREIPSFELPIPPIADQIEVSNILGSLDDRIMLLRETNATLEAIAQALFKSWFVDFDPVRAKQQGQIPEGMDEATAALFPDGFEDATLCVVPKGWRILPLAEAYQINPMRKLKKGELAPYLDMASVNTGGHTVSTTISREFGSGTKFVDGDTLLARITPCLENGKTAFVDFLADDQTGWGSTEFVVLRPKEPLPSYHGYLLSRHLPFREYAIQSMSGTSGRQRIQNDILGRFPIVVPCSEIGAVFGEISESIQKTITANHERAQTLASIRDALLPRLISGQLRITEAEAAIEKAAA